MLLEDSALTSEVLPEAIPVVEPEKLGSWNITSTPVEYGSKFSTSVWSTGVGEGEGDGLGEGDGVGEGVGLGDRLGVGLGVALGEAVGDSVGVGDGVGVAITSGLCMSPW
jgi:hypothetical protein